MQRVGLVAQYAVSDTSSAAMTEHSHGLKPTLPIATTVTILFPNFPRSELQSDWTAEAAPDVYFPCLYPFDLIRQEAPRALLNTLDLAASKANKFKMLRQPPNACVGDWGT